ncbi:MAG TPA: alanine racemase [Candidatus Binataceae bacterium]|nr:alanine racemase [Candidatus Binataceae bacterium]
MHTTDQLSHRAVAEIDLEALRLNYRQLKRLASHAEMMVVVKADAYGHGAVAVSRALAAEGCSHFGVATVSEARELRAAGNRDRIYLLGGFFADDAREIVALDLTPFVFDRESIHAIGAAAAALGRRDFPVHLKLDTGATRLGVRLDELAGAIEQLRREPSLALEGTGTLLASAHDPASPVTDRQLAEFGEALHRLAAAGFAPPVNHVANSAALVMRADAHRNLVRPGLAIYGLPPVPAVAERVALRPVMTFKTRLLQTKRVGAGAGVSYGHTFVTQHPSTIGVVAVGYADGYRRGLQHGGEVLIRGRRAPVVGAVCMDLTMVDLTGVPDARAGDEVILWGVSGGETISVNDVARLAQTISYEMLCTVGRRVARVYRN